MRSVFRIDSPVKCRDSPTYCMEIHNFIYETYET